MTTELQAAAAEIEHKNEPSATSSDEVEKALAKAARNLGWLEALPPYGDKDTRKAAADEMCSALTELRAHIAALEADNKRLREAEQWQPIETAPKDGTYIFATDVGNHPISKEPWVGDACYWNGRSFDNDSDSLDERDWWKPTLWMPMPPPPHKDTCVVCGHVHVGLACPTLSVTSTRE